MKRASVTFLPLMYDDRMVQRRREIEQFMRHIVAEIEAAEAAGIRTPEAIAEHLNAKSLTSRKGRPWSGEAVAKFLSSAGARRYSSDGNPTYRAGVITHE